MSENDCFLTLTDLSTPEIIRKNKILELYANYWSDDIPLKPHLNFDEVQPMLEDAAEIVSRIRYYVDTTVNQNAMFTLRTNDGAANRYLFYTDTNPTEEKEKFLRELVVATLSSMSNTENQLESGVSLELIDSFISAFNTYKNELNEKGKPRQPYESYSKENLLTLLHEASQLADQIFNIEDENRDQNEEKIFLKAMVKSIENYYLYFLRYQQNSKFNHSIESPSRSELPELFNDFVVIEREVDEHFPSVTYSTPEYKPSDTESEKAMDKGDEEIKGVAESKSGEAEEEKSIEGMEGRIETDEISEGAAGTISDENKEKPEVAQKGEYTQKASGFIKIAKIESDIENTESELDHLHEAVTTINVDYSKPREALHEVEDLLRKCLYWGEALMKDLLTLDTFSSDHPQAETREIRKKQAIEIQQLMDDLEELKEPLKTHQTALFKIVHQLDEEEKKINEEKQKQLEKEQELKKEKEKEKEKIEAEMKMTGQKKKQTAADRKRGGTKRTAGGSAFPFLPTELQQFFSNFNPTGEMEDEGMESDIFKPFADIMSPARQQRRRRRPNRSRPDLQLATPDTFSEELDEEIEEDLEEDKGMYGEDEDSDLYYSLLRQWKLMKFEPQVETERQRGRYLLSANIPGMREDDFHIQINERDSLLTISGCRLPSRSEFERIKENAIRRYRVTSQRELTKILLRYGIHRYGTFSTSLSLPRNVVYSKIEAKYEDGSLIVIAPFLAKKQSSIPVRSRGIYDDFDNPFPSNRGFRTNSPSDFYSPLFFS